MQSLKETAECFVIQWLRADPFIAALNPEKQNDDGEPVKPYVAVVCNPGAEYSPGSVIRNIPTNIELFFNAAQEGQSDIPLDDISARIEARMVAMRNAGTVGVLIHGELVTTFIDGTTRKRSFSYTLIAAQVSSY